MITLPYKATLSGPIGHAVWAAEGPGLYHSFSERIKSVRLIT